MMNAGCPGSFLKSIYRVKICYIFFSVAFLFAFLLFQVRPVSADIEEFQYDDYEDSSYYSSSSSLSESLDSDYYYSDYSSSSSYQDTYYYEDDSSDYSSSSTGYQVDSSFSSSSSYNDYSSSSSYYDDSNYSSSSSYEDANYSSSSSYFIDTVNDDTLEEETCEPQEFYHHSGSGVYRDPEITEYVSGSSYVREEYFAETKVRQIRVGDVYTPTLWEQTAEQETHRVEKVYDYDSCQFVQTFENYYLEKLEQEYIHLGPFTQILDYDHEVYNHQGYDSTSYYATTTVTRHEVDEETGNLKVRAEYTTTQVPHNSDVRSGTEEKYYYAPNGSMTKSVIKQWYGDSMTPEIFEEDYDIDPNLF